MSAILLIGIPFVGLTVVCTTVTLFDTEVVRIIRELINTLVKTTNYRSDKIFKIIHLYV